MSSLSSESNPAADAFASATLEIVQNKRGKLWGGSPRYPSSPTSDGLHKTRAYYRDSSGRARIHLRVRLAVPSIDNGGGGLRSGAEALLECGCIKPEPSESTGEALLLSPSDNNDTDTSAKEKNDVDDNDDDGSVWHDELSTIGKEMEGEEVKSPWYTDTTFTFECNTICSSSTSNSSNGNDKTTSSWALEGVTILHSQIERSSSPDNPQKKPSPISAILFDIEVAVGGHGVKMSDTTNNVQELLEEGELEVRAVLRQKKKYRGSDGGEKQSSSTIAAKSLLGGNDGGGIAAGLLGLEFGGGALSPSVLSTTTRGGYGSVAPKNRTKLHYDTRMTRTPSLQIHATLIPPLQLTVREVPGARAASGSTLVEITVEHSTRWHKEDVVVTGIAFHPGQSRLYEVENNGDEGKEGDEDSDPPPNSNKNASASEGKSMQGGELSVIDMSRRVRWGFAPGSAPELPLVLGPYEAFATVIQIDAGEDVRSRAFLSPISVNAMVGGSVNSVSPDKSTDSVEKTGERIMITHDARWTSSRVGIENSDAFRVDMSLRGGQATACRVGAPLVVSLRVLNLSMEPRDLMLLMAKDGEGRHSGLKWERKDNRRTRSRSVESNREQPPLLHQYPQQSKENHSFNTAVVSEVNGYTFGVWGLSGDDDGTTRHHRDHELLAVDAALLLGEVKGQHSIEAELRFVPLREGTLDVPNLKLYDKRGMKWYNCVHTLKIVARQSNV